MEASIDRNHKTYAIGGTLLSLLILLIPIVMVTFKTPLPPFEESGLLGIEVNLGFEDEGMGQDYSDKPFADKNNPNNPSQKSEDNSNPSDNNNVITDDSPDNNVVVKNDKNKNDKKKNDDPKPDQNLLNASNVNFNDGNPKSDGDKNKEGNQGKEDGKIDSKSYTGDSPWKGEGKKPGVSLKGRQIQKWPDDIKDFSQKAIVVVDITVDKNGKVIEAKVNNAKSTFGDPQNASTLRAKARQAAFTTKFNESPDGTPEQKGTITFVFKVQ